MSINCVEQIISKHRSNKLYSTSWREEGVFVLILRTVHILIKYALIS